MKIRLSELRRLIREALSMSAGAFKPGDRLRYTGQFDPEKPDFVKVLSVQNNVVTVGDKRGKTYKLTDQDLQSGAWEHAEGAPGAPKKPAPWEATR